MFVAFKLDLKIGFCYHWDKPNKPTVIWATDKAINTPTKFVVQGGFTDPIQRLPGGPSGTPSTQSPRYSTPRWQKHSRPPPPEWSVPSGMPSKWHGTEATWILCKDFSAIRSAIPRESPRIPNLLHLLLKNYSFS